VVAVSKALQSDLQTYYGIPTKKVTPVYNGVDTKIFRRDENPRVPARLREFEGKRKILYVGHLGPRKGLFYLIRAMKTIVKEVPDVILVCIGEAPAESRASSYKEFLFELVHASNLDGTVIFIGTVPNSELPAYYSASDVFILPSFYKSFGKVVIEAMACETPVVVTGAGGVLEIVENNQTGLLVKYGSEAEIAAAIITILQGKLVVVE